MELKEYATEVDVEFVRKAVRAIGKFTTKVSFVWPHNYAHLHNLPLILGRCAIKLDRAAEKCIKVLLELIQTKVNYVVQEAIIVIKVNAEFSDIFIGFDNNGWSFEQDIFRKYPNRYESIIATLCENLNTLDDPEAKVRSPSLVTFCLNSDLDFDIRLPWFGLLENMQKGLKTLMSCWKPFWITSKKRILRCSCNSWLLALSFSLRNQKQPKKLFRYTIACILAIPTQDCAHL